jgi:hypothetical protein
VVVAVSAVIAAFLLSRPTAAGDDFTFKLPEGQVDALVRKGDVDSLLAAAALTALVDIPAEAERSRAVEYARRASSAAPSDPVVQAIWLGICREFIECDRHGAAKDLERAAPDNALSWMLLMEDAAKAHDVAGVDGALERVASSSHLRLYWNPMVTRITDALTADGVRPLNRLSYWSRRENFATAVGAAAMIGLPAFLPVKQVCIGAIDLERRSRCDLLLQLMRNGDTLLTQHLGIALTLKSAEPDSEAYRAAIARRRELDWISEQLFENETSTFEQLTQSSTGRRLSLMRRHDGEIEVMEALLRDRDIPVKPPEGWTKKNASA